MKPQVSVTPAELDWLQDGLNRGATGVQLHRSMRENFETSRTLMGLYRVIRDYGLRPDETVEWGSQEFWNLVIWGRIQTFGEVHAKHFEKVRQAEASRVKSAMRWLVRSEAAHLGRYEPGEGIRTRIYRDPKSIYINEEYKPWTPWST